MKAQKWGLKEYERAYPRLMEIAKRLRVENERLRAERVSGTTQERTGEA